MAAYLIINGIIFLIVGMRALLKPVDAVAVPYGLTADGVDARNYLRAGAGGVTIACGGVQVVGGVIPVLSLPALVLAVAVLGGLVFGRLFSLLKDGSPGPVSWISGALESLGFVLGAFWLAQMF